MKPERNALLARTFGPKRYWIGYHSDSDGHVTVSNTEHSEVWVPPPTMTGRRADRGHQWTEDNARVHALHADGEPFGPYVWEHDAGDGFPKLKRQQLATWKALHEIDDSIGLRPGASIIQSFPVAWCGTKPRPIAIDPSDDCSGYQQWDWFNGHDGAPIRVSTDMADLDIDVVIVETLHNAAVDWGLPRDLDVPDVIVVDLAHVRRTGRRGLAFIEQGTTPVITDVDAAHVVTDAYDQLGATRFAQLVGGEVHDGKHLGEGRHPRTATIDRLVKGAAGSAPQAFARFADKVAAAAPRCAYDGCTTVIKPRCTYCPPHGDLVRRVKNRARMRVIRARDDQEPT